MPHRAATPRQCDQAPHTASGQDTPAVPTAIVGEGSSSRPTLVPNHVPLLILLLIKLLHYYYLAKHYLCGFMYSIPSPFTATKFLESLSSIGNRRLLGSGEMDIFFVHSRESLSSNVNRRFLESGEMDIFVVHMGFFNVGTRAGRVHTHFVSNFADSIGGHARRMVLLLSRKASLFLNRSHQTTPSQ